MEIKIKSELKIRPKDKKFRSKIKLEKYFLSIMKEEIQNYYDWADYDVYEIAYAYFKKLDNQWFLELEYKKIYLVVTPSIFIKNHQIKFFLDNLISRIDNDLYSIINDEGDDYKYVNPEKYEDAHIDPEDVKSREERELWDRIKDELL